MRTFRIAVVLIVSGLFLSGCGMFSSTKLAEPIDVAQPIKVVEANQSAILFMQHTIESHMSDYSIPQMGSLLQAQGALHSILEYAERLGATGQANICNISTLWNQAQIEYYRLYSVIKTDNWEEHEKIIYEMLNREAHRLAVEVDYSLSIAGDNADRKTMDAILSQIQTVFSVILPMM